MALQIAKGAAFLHSKGVIHRDLKHDNVLLDPHDVVKLCDFGISRTVDRGGGGEGGMQPVTTVSHYL